MWGWTKSCARLARVRVPAQAMPMNGRMDLPMGPTRPLSPTTWRWRGSGLVKVFDHARVAYARATAGSPGWN